MNILAIGVAALVIAFFTGSDSLFYLTYALIGIAVLSRWWTRHSLQAVGIERHFSSRAFHGEKITAVLSIRNSGRLPVPWLYLHESLPIALHSPNFERRVVSLAPGERASLTYELNCSRRGYYHLGPLRLESGDLLGVAENHERAFATDSLIVYPRIIPLRHLEIPSQIPFGSAGSRQQIFEDPSRFFGVREYAPHDSLRQIHWKSSARMDQLQTKRFQPSLALHALIVLDLNLDAYNLKSRATAGEMGIVVAASFAAHLIEHRHQVGLAVLGKDQVSDATGFQNTRLGHGREHLMRLLEVLARAEMAPTSPLPGLLTTASAGLSWGSTVIVIIPGNEPALLPALLQVRRRGLYPVVIATDPLIPFHELRDELKQVGIPAVAVTQDRDMDEWR